MFLFAVESNAGLQQGGTKVARALGTAQSMTKEAGGFSPRSRDVKSTFVWRRLAEICESERDANELSEAALQSSSEIESAFLAPTTPPARASREAGRACAAGSLLASPAPSDPSDKELVTAAIVARDAGGCG